jgi:DNA-binding response OmpR family regulator
LLLNRAWGEEYDATPPYLKVYISRLRAKDTAAFALSGG